MPGNMPSPGDKPPPRKKPGASPIIRTPPGPRADPANVAERLTGLTHDLASLLDGSLRQVGLLMREGGSGGTDEEPTHKRLLAIRTALEQMVVMVTAAARGLSLAPGAAASERMHGPRAGLAHPPVMSLADAVHHAVAIMEPSASEQGITLRCAIDPRLEHVDARGLYTVMVNALRNAVESIVRRRPRAVRGRARGEIEVVARAGPLSRGMDEPSATVSIIDDGEGLPIPPPGVARGQQAPDVFAQGFSTKQGSLGIGLSMARDIVTSAGGRIRLRPSPRADGTGGAELLIELPARAYDTPAGFGDAEGRANAA